MTVSAEIWGYSIASVFIVSLISLIGITVLSINEKTLKRILIYLVAFAAGALMGDVFIHLLPELAEQSGLTLISSLYILVGIVIFFVAEKVINWHHCHITGDTHHVHNLPKNESQRKILAKMNLVGDGIHNILDGVIIAASYLISIPVGIATTVAVLLHEIPQEIGDFGVLLHGGYSKSKALLLNLVIALTSLIGASLALYFSNSISGLETFLVPLAAGGFIYIAGSDLIPELHNHEFSVKKSLLQLIFFLLGIGVMLILLLI